MSDLVSVAYPRNFIVVGDLDGKDVTLTIERVSDKNTVKREDGTLIDKWVIHFREAKKPFVLGDANAKLAQIALGNDKRKWPGQRMVLYPTKTETSRAFAEQAGCVILGPGRKGKVAVPCIRVRVSGADAPAVTETRNGEGEW